VGIGQIKHADYSRELALGYNQDKAAKNQVKVNPFSKRHASAIPRSQQGYLNSVGNKDNLSNQFPGD